jgi:hypothetical protein
LTKAGSARRWPATFINAVANRRTLGWWMPRGIAILRKRHSKTRTRSIEFQRRRDAPPTVRRKKFSLVREGKLQHAI